MFSEWSSSTLFYQRQQTMSGKIGQLNEEVIKGQIKELVRGSVEEALLEMYPAGISVRRVEDITEALWGSKVSGHYQ